MEEERENFKNTGSHSGHRKVPSSKRLSSSEKKKSKQLPGTRWSLLQDEEKIDGSILSHYTFRQVASSNFVSPVEEVLKKGAVVLDVACGPGAWVLEMATDFPNSTFKGFDVAPIFPVDVMPANVEFTLADFLKGVPYPDNYFDFVHCRAINLGCGESYWESVVIPELVRVLKPGGWVEIAEHEMCISFGPTWVKFNQILSTWLETKGVNPKICYKIEGYLRNTAKLKTINSGKWSISMNPSENPTITETMRGWGRSIGNLIAGEHGMTNEQWDSQVEALIGEAKAINGVTPCHYFYAQKE